MLTREQIEEIQTENRERGVSIKKLLKEKGVSERQYYRWKRQYERPEAPEGFLPIVGAGLPTQVAAHLSGTAPSVKAKSFGTKKALQARNSVKRGKISPFVIAPLP